MAMIIDGYALTKYPSSMTMIKKYRLNSYIETLSAVDHFSWGLFIIGKEIKIRWNFLASQEWDFIYQKFLADKIVVWNPGIPDCLDTYNVQILDFVGDYFIKLKTESGTYRQNSEMTLLIMSQATGGDTILLSDSDSLTISEAKNEGIS